MNIPAWLSFLFKAIALGLIMSLVMLALVPELRHGDSVSLSSLFQGTKEPEKISYYQAISQAAPAVVNIYSISIDVRSSNLRGQQVGRTSLGSGVIMTDSGYVLTCLHVINNAEAIIVGLQDGRRLNAEIVGHDTITDLAVLKISDDNLPVIPQLTDPQTKVGDVVLAIGNPYNLGQTITQGIVSRRGRNFYDGSASANSVNFIQTDAVLHQGNSGGALVDSNGYLVGINNANFKTLINRRRVRDVNGVFFALPYQLAHRVMQQIIDSGRASHAHLGFSGQERPGQKGIYVDQVQPQGAAQKAGLQSGDLIVSIDKQPITSVISAMDIVANSTPGTVLEFGIERNNQSLTIPITVADLKTN